MIKFNKILTNTFHEEVPHPDMCFNDYLESIAASTRAIFQNFLHNVQRTDTLNIVEYVDEERLFFFG